ncbi:MAG: hypothetical protein AABX74_05575 [Nanoarchaeota archaeon]
MDKDLIKDQPTFVIRGLIVARSINIEHLVSLILAHYYGNKEHFSSFIEEFLLHENCTLGLKLNVFLKLELHKNRNDIKDPKKFEQDLRELFKIRNTVAHSIDLPSVSKVSIFHSKICKPIEIDKLYERFFSIYHEVFPKLDNIFGELADFSRSKFRFQETMKNNNDKTL